MREADFLEAVGRVNSKYIEECITYKKPNVKAWARGIAAVAASFALVIGTVFAVRQFRAPVIIDENGFYIEDGVLLSYTGEETDVTLPESVKKVADFAFMDNDNANKIEIVRLGASVETVEANAFAGLESLVDIIVAENNLSFLETNGLIMSSDGTILLKYEREGETSFTLPKSVKIVCAHAVQGTDLEEIDFGDSLEYIGYAAFASNYKLRAIYLPDSVKFIDEIAFAGCTNAVDGYVPEDAQIAADSFDRVPFWLTKLAGQMSPAEEMRRGLVTPSEAIVKSDTVALYKQIEYILATLRGEEYNADEDAMRAHAAVLGAPTVPCGATVPEDFTLDDLTYADKGWGGTGIYDIQIMLQAGDYTMVFEAYAYGLDAELYWEDVPFRITNLYFMQNEVDGENSVSAFGWTAIFEQDADGYYSGITYIHEDGRIIRDSRNNLSTRPYVLTFSPDGTRVAVEYKFGGKDYFYVRTLNGDKLMHDLYDYNEYLNRYYGEYVGGTLYWADNDNIEGENEYGLFRFNIYGSEATWIGEAPVSHVDLTMLCVDQLHLNVAELRENYGELYLVGSEHGPGQPYYNQTSREFYLVFHNWSMYDPLEDDMIPDEVLIYERGYIVRDIAIGDDISIHAELLRGEERNTTATYDMINGTIYIRAEFEAQGIAVTYIVSGDGTYNPHDGNLTDEEWDAWEAEFLENPHGEVVSIRVARLD